MELNNIIRLVGNDERIGFWNKNRALACLFSLSELAFQAPQIVARRHLERIQPRYSGSRLSRAEHARQL